MLSATATAVVLFVMWGGAHQREGGYTISAGVTVKQQQDFDDVMHHMQVSLNIWFVGHTVSCRRLVHPPQTARPRSCGSS